MGAPIWQATYGSGHGVCGEKIDRSHILCIRITLKTDEKTWKLAKISFAYSEAEHSIPNENLLGAQSVGENGQILPEIIMDSAWCVFLSSGDFE